MRCGSKLKKKIVTITKKASDIVREYAGYALEISSNLKVMLDSPLGELVTAIIPGSWDDNLKAKGSSALGKAIDVLALTTDIANEPDLEKKLKMFTEALADKSPEFRESQLKKIMDLITKYMDGEKLKDHEYEAITMANFISVKK